MPAPPDVWLQCYKPVPGGLEQVCTIKSLLCSSKDCADRVVLGNTSPSHTPVKLCSHAEPQLDAASPAMLQLLCRWSLFQFMQCQRGRRDDGSLNHTLVLMLSDAVIYLRYLRRLSNSWDALAHISTNLEMLLNNYLCSSLMASVAVSHAGWSPELLRDVPSAALVFSNLGSMSTSNQNVLTATSI